MDPSSQLRTAICRRLHIMPSSENTTILSPATISNSEQHGQGTTTFSASVTKEDAVHLTRFPKPDERQDEECQICRDDLKPKDRAQLIPCFHWQYHKEVCFPFPLHSKNLY